MPELIAFISETVVMLSHLKHCLYMKRILSCSLSSCPSARQQELSQLLLTMQLLAIYTLLRWF